jgi:hypothetical protein
MPALAAVILLTVTQPFDVAQGGPELIERTLAIVGGQAITLSDVRAALALGLIEPPADSNPIPGATRRLIERALVLREVERYAPPEPPETAVDERMRATIARFSSPDAFRAVLASAAFTEAQVRTWLADDLRMAAYINQRFTDAERRADLIVDWIADLRRRTPVVEIVKN